MLVDQIERVVVCNVRVERVLTNKNDRIDADGISEHLRLGGLKSVFHGATEMLTRGGLVRKRQQPGRGLDTLMLRIKAILRVRASQTPGVSVYRPWQRKQWLTQLTGRDSRAVSMSWFHSRGRRSKI